MAGKQSVKIHILEAVLIFIGSGVLFVIFFIINK